MDSPASSQTATARADDLERLYRGQLLGLGAVALEMHQNGELDESTLMALAAEAAETERELRRRGPS